MICAEPSTRRGDFKGVKEDLQRRILFEDEYVFILDKPAGIAVQGGTNIEISIDELASTFLSENDQGPK